MISLKKIQKWMKDNKIDIFIISHNDEFLNEYLADYAERLKWISNFSGSAGRAIIEQQKAYIFIDGRYINQVKQEVDLNLFKIKNLQDYWLFLKQYKKDKKTLALDPKLHSIIEVEKAQKIYKNTNIKLNYLKKNPIDNIWWDQPPLPTSKAFIHDEKYAGESINSKISRVQEILKTNNIDFYLLISLDSIAWLLNLRGEDIKNTPLLFCSIIIPKQGKIELFIDQFKIYHLINLLSDFININSFIELDKYLLSIDLKKNIAMDEEITSFHFKNILKNKDHIIQHLENPCLYPKAIKNDLEIEGARSANLRDGVSVTKFLFWLKNTMIVEETNEIKAANHLFNLRKNNHLFFSPSFDTISAFGSNAALPHYRVSNKTNLFFKTNSIYLVDSGVQYKDGTTDITRTIIIGDPTNEQKNMYTRVLKGHIAIAEVIFEVGTRGSTLDLLARKSLQEVNCDYAHGTGHGIGSFLNVHEGPQRIAKSKNQSDGIIKPGMILSNEPGYYKNNEYGIRIENIIICKTNKKNYLYFETISLAPIDKDLIEINLLNNKEIEWLNSYHKKVYEKISPQLSRKEELWLKFVTSPILS